MEEPAISFGTGGWRATREEFTDERVRRVARAVATYVAETEGRGGTVGVAYDARAGSESAAESVADVLAADGFDVLLTDRDLPTPLLAHAIADRGLAGGVVVTASHNPPEYNGLKFVPGDAMAPLPAVTEAIESNLASPASRSAERGSIERFDPAPAHAARAEALVSEYFDTDLSGLTVVYDAIHGSGRGVTDALLESAGATVIRRRCDRDPEFGGVAPEPGPETLSDLAGAVEARDADLGIANDGDADRVAVCTPDRGVLTGHLLFATLYDALLRDGGASGPAVRTVSTTFLIDRIAAAHDTEVYEVPVGFKWVADGLKRHDALFGGEESGGFTLRGHVGQKDGVLIALLAAAAAAADPFDDRIDRLFATHGRVFADKRSVACPDDRKEAVLDALEGAIPETVAGGAVEETVTLDGFKLLLEDGSWLLVRPSGTEPKLRVYAESTEEARVDALLDAGVDLLEPLVG